MQSLTHTAILTFVQVGFRVVVLAHILHVMQAVIRQNDVVIGTSFSARGYGAAACQLANARIGFIVTFRER